MTTAHGAKPRKPRQSRAEPKQASSMARALEVWLAEYAPARSARCGAVVELARSLAAGLDSDSRSNCQVCGRSGTTAPMAREYRVTLDALAGLLALEGEGDGEAAVVLSLSTAVRDSKKSG